MNRLLMTDLEAWKARSGRKPLILMGVRQTGKTYLLEQFGKKCFKRYHIINFEKQASARTLFDGDLDPKRIIDDLSFYLSTEIDIHHDLIIFDEIQACPRALTSLKYFCEDLSELALCSAGSLLGLHLSDTSYPVGKVDMLHLHPLTFTEFLNGVGDQYATEYLSNIKIDSKIPEANHQQLWQRLKQYFVTGGLPEVVTTFNKHQKNMYEATNAVRIKQDELIKAYYADIAKHSGDVNAMHIDRVWRSVPKQLAENQDSSTNRFKFKGIIPNVNRYAQLINVIDWLESAELVIKLPVVGHVEQPLSAFTKDNIFKLMMFDVGILGAVSGLAPKTILDYGYGTYQGYFAENYVAQQLNAFNHKQLFCWQEDRSEIEFILDVDGEIMPIEVKSGKITRAKSLQKYIDKYNPQRSVIFSAKELRLSKSRKVMHLPLYLADKVFKGNKEII